MKSPPVMPWLVEREDTEHDETKVRDQRGDNRLQVRYIAATMAAIPITAITNRIGARSTAAAEADSKAQDPSIAPADATDPPSARRCGRPAARCGTGTTGP